MSNVDRQKESEVKFGSYEDTPFKYLVRKIAYSPLTALERIAIFRKCRAPFLNGVVADRYALFERTQGLHGSSIESAISIIRCYGHPVDNPRVLVLGCGQGREIVRWQKEDVNYLVGQEYFDFTSDWSRISKKNTAILRSDIGNLPFLDGVFNIIFAKAVFEHLGKFEASIREIHRVMRSGALIWADFGPLWYTWGGAHEDISYDHLLLNNEELSRRFQPGGEGYLFWHNDMFSRLRESEYRSILSKYFEILRWGIGISTWGLKFRKTHAGQWKELCRRYPERDLLIWAIYFLGTKLR